MKPLILLPVLLAACCPDVPCPDPVICPVCDTTSKDSLQTLLTDARVQFVGLTARYYVAKDSLFITQVELANVKDQLEDCLLQECPECPPPVICPSCPCDTLPPIDTTEPPITGTLFESDFEPPVSIIQTGNNGEPFRITNFDEFYEVYGVGSFIFNISPPAYTLAAIRPDPENGDNCMFGEVIADDPSEGGTSRFQTSLRTDADLDIIHFSYDVWWSPDIMSLETRTSKIDWFTVIELWEDHNDSWDGDVSGQARWNMGFFKDATGPLYWNLHMELMQPASVRFDTYWTTENRSVPIPLGKWVNLDFRFERGQQGRITVKLDGQVLFDVVRPTEYPETPLPIWAINTMKLYTSTTNVNIIKAVGRLYAYYDNFKWYEK